MRMESEMVSGNGRIWAGSGRMDKDVNQVKGRCDYILLVTCVRNAIGLRTQTSYLFDQREAVAWERILTLIDLTKHDDTRKLCLRVSIDFRMKDEYPCLPVSR